MILPTQSASITGYVDTSVLVLRIDGDKPIDSSTPPQQTEHPHNPAVVTSHSQDVTIENDQVDARSIHLLAVEETDVFHTDVIQYLCNWALLKLCRDVGHQSKVFHKSTCLNIRIESLGMPSL